LQLHHEESMGERLGWRTGPLLFSRQSQRVSGVAVSDMNSHGPC
jgi:hypothetical protein